MSAVAPSPQIPSVDASARDCRRNIRRSCRDNADHLRPIHGARIPAPIAACAEDHTISRFLKGEVNASSFAFIAHHSALITKFEERPLLRSILIYSSCNRTRSNRGSIMARGTNFSKALPCPKLAICLIKLLDTCAYSSSAMRNTVSISGSS